MNSKPKDYTAGNGLGLEMVTVGSVESKEVRWVWNNRFPLGHLSLIVGAPGLGKSFIALDIAARLSVTGGVWPDRTAKSVCGAVYVFSGEDSIADTIRPRLEKLGADVNLIDAARLVRERDKDGKIRNRAFSLVHDMPKLEELLKTRPQIRLIIIDPVSSYIGGTDSHKNAELRSDVLTPLAVLAEKYDVAIVAITHFNKGNQEGIERVSGSVAFPAAARIVWGIVQDVEDKAKRYLLFAKGNLGPEMTGLAYRLVADPVNPKAQPDLEWLAGDVDMTLEDFQRLATTKHAGGAKPEATDEAEELLKQFLSEGRRSGKDVYAAAKAEGIARSTLKNAADKLGVLRVRVQGFQGGTTWELRAKPHTPESSLAE